MTRFLCSLVLIVLANTAVAGESKQGKAAPPPDDFKALPGVWGSADGAKLNVRLMFMDGKVGFHIKDGKTGDLQMFLGLTDAKFAETKGKRLFNMEVAKDTSYSVVITKLEDDRLTVEIHDRGAFTLTRLSVRASKSPEAKKLLGTWKITGGEVGGQPKSAREIGLDEISFQEDHYSLKSGGQVVLKSFYGIDPAKKPASMNWFGMKADFVIPLIYEVNGTELRLCHPVLGKDAWIRPTIFDTKGTPSVLIRAKRAK